MKKQIIITSIFSALALGFLSIGSSASAAEMNSQGNMTTTTTTTSTDNQTNMSDHASTIVSDAYLVEGSEGHDVVHLQGFLESKGFLKLPRGVVKGYFGRLTRQALANYQASMGLEADGNFGPITRATARGEGNSMGSSMSHIMMPNTDTKAAGIRVLLNSINREHANLASVALRKGFDGATDFNASFKALDDNSIEIGNSITSVYGADAGAKFLEIWRSHIVYFKNYTVASKTNDQAGKAKAVEDLAGYVNRISTFLSQANPNLPFDAVHGLVATHVGLLKDTIDQYFAGNLAASYAQQHATDVQIGTGVADAVAGAIVKQFPEKF